VFVYVQLLYIENHHISIADAATVTASAAQSVIGLELERDGKIELDDLETVAKAYITVLPMVLRDAIWQK